MSAFPEPVYCKMRPEVGARYGLPANYETDGGKLYCRVVLVSFTSSTVRVQHYFADEGEARVIEVPRADVILPRGAADVARSTTPDEARRQLGLC